MSFSVNTNITSLEAQQYLRSSNEFQGKTIQHVTSGLRITTSGDDAAGLAIANGYRSDEAVLNQGIRNANDGLSQLQTIDGGLSNISALLDRARTLATQSASGAFASGDAGRVTLNQEFKSVLQEIDRQAQSIGLDQNGAFAKNLSIFIGGGRTHGVANATANGTVGVDLSNSAVDSKSLGLKGVQVVGSGIDLSAGQATNVQNVISDATNRASEAAAGYTTFRVAGAGFSDANKISVSVNLSGVSDLNTLATAINSAITASGSAGTLSATAFKNANINATVVTDANTGQQHIAFNSANSAFQIEAGDRTANALLGKTTAPGSTTGLAVSSTVTAASSSAAGTTTVSNPGSIVFRFQGSGLTASKDITLSSSDTTVAAAVADLATQVSNDATLKAAGISLTSAAPGSPLVFTSAKGESFSVQVTGDSSNTLGFGSFLSGTSSAVDYSSITAGSAYDATTTKGVANFEFSVGGAASSSHAVSVDLSAGDATAAAVTGSTVGATFAITAGTNDQVSFSVDGKSYSGTLTAGGARTQAQILTDLNGILGSAGTASFVNNQLVITSASKGAGSSVQIRTPATHDASATLGLTSGGAAVTGQSRSAANLVAYLNSAINSDSTLQAAGISASQSSGTITFSSANSSYFRLNTVGVHASVSSSVAGANYNVTAGTNDQLTFSIDGGPAINITLAAQTNATAATVAADITSKLSVSQQAQVTVDGSSGSLVFRSASTGALSSVQFSASALHDSLAALGFTAATTTGAGPNVGFGAANGVSFAGNTAAAPAESTFDASGAYQLTSANGSAQPLTFSGIAYGSDTQSITISANDLNGQAQTLNVSLGNNATGGVGGTPLRNARSLDEAIATINSELQQSNNATLQGILAVKDNSSGVEKINFLSASTNFKVTAGMTANGTGMGSQGATAGSGIVGAGGTADISNQSSAQAAVTALSAAVEALGTSQAVVGRGENEFTFAVNLAQSQVTNLAASESQIRDADLASEAANLTKAQILLQAGTAALAQANAAPQALLSLLQGH